MVGSMVHRAVVAMVGKVLDRLSQSTGNQGRDNEELKGK
jgi:hypothetical protein